MSGFKTGHCTCGHTTKHHKLSGRCRRGCDCNAALFKAAMKGKT